jgi:hypothetical protein
MNKTIFAVLATTILAATVAQAWDMPISEREIHQYNWKRTMRPTNM